SEKDGTAFKMPVPISINGKLTTHTPVGGLITINAKKSDIIVIDPQMKVLRQLPIISQCQQQS
ncbi:hypothetical protein R0K30_23165, partial [Bacillus sp. SIMBA_154]|uniref:hypothetical protein n=1 Tax=Bacillus sp. SIMBA_154 TaxID=3080859 RepID=UPI0039796593